MNLRWTLLRFWLPLGALALVACAGQPVATLFYTLAPVAELQGEPRPDLSVGLGPVDIPQLIDRPQLVTRRSPTEVDVAENQQWGGSLDRDIPRVLARDLAALLGTERVLLHPWDPRHPPGFQVRVAFDRFDGAPGGRVEVQARWSILAGGGGEELVLRRTVLVEPVAGASFDAYVNALSRALGRMAEEIAAALRSQPSGTTGPG